MDLPPAAASVGTTIGELDVLSRTHGSLEVFEISGRLDVSSATRLLSLLAPSAATGVRVVVCDLSGLAVPSMVSLLTVFPTAQRRSGPWPRTAFHLAAPSPGLALHLRAMGMARFVPIHASMRTALEAATHDGPTSREELRMVPDPANSRSAREALLRLWPDGDDGHDRRHDGLIVVSELTTIADRHVRRPFSATMTLSPHRLLIAVTDQSRQEPILRPIEPSAIGGRGLQLVAALSQSWGVRLIEGRGKTVWSALERDSAASQVTVGY